MKHKYIGHLVGLLLVLGLVFFYYSSQIFEANNIVYGQYGDGYKNYYTLAYYLKNDSLTHFTGMNYPYGEHVMFTDNQPAIAWMLKTVSAFFPSITLYVHGFLSWSIFLCLLIAAYFLYRILREFDIDEIHAALFAVLIALMSPQLKRLMGHFSLGYSCFLPIVFYLLLKLFKSNGAKKYVFSLTGVIIFFSFIHIYYLAISGMFILLVATFFVIANLKSLKHHLRFISLLAFTGIMPFVIMKFFLFCTDSIADRPQTPWGFLATRSTIADIFLSQHSFTGELIGMIAPNGKIVYHFEGSGYIGLVSVLYLFVLVGLLVARIRTKSKTYIVPYPLSLYLCASTVMLLFAMAFPFSLDSFEKYYNHLPSIVKQFRASGRFNWVFYYSATLVTAILAHHMFCRLKLRSIWVGWLFIIAVYSIWFIELNMISVRTARDFITQSLIVDEPGDREELLRLLQEVDKTPRHFQAILPLPFFLNGSEKLYLESGASFDAMKSSLLTGLPLVCGQMSRTSVSQTYKIANLLSSDLVRKEIIHEYNNDKPLLLMTVGNFFNNEEKKLINRGIHLFSHNEINYYELPLQTFADIQDSVKKFIAQDFPTFHSQGDYTSPDTINDALIIRYENDRKDYAAFGHGAYYSEKDVVYFYFDTLPNARDSADYEVSLWMYSDHRTAAFPVIFLNQLDTAGNEVSKHEVNGKFSTNTFGKWVRIQIDFTLFHKKNKILLVGSGSHASYDEVLIRPKDKIVISDYENDSTFMYNNFPIR